VNAQDAKGIVDSAILFDGTVFRVPRYGLALSIGQWLNAFWVAGLTDSEHRFLDAVEQ
jgi:hypothetical protein